LRARVTSKGGTTERALNCMEDAELKRKFIEAVKQAGPALARARRSDR
jgi:pyrroline-5-carboxylate reductase